MGTPQDSEATRKKLLEAAGELFAQKGFSAVTVREIVAKAQTHLSAMNYHFKSKDALYQEVLEYACKQSAISMDERDYLSQIAPDKALLILIKEAVKAYRSDYDTQWKTALIAHEIRQPGSHFAAISERYLKPDIDYIAQLVAAAAGAQISSHASRFAAISLIGLIETFGLHTTFIEAVAPGLHDFYDKDHAFSHAILTMVLHGAKDYKEG